MTEAERAAALADEIAAAVVIIEPHAFRTRKVVSSDDRSAIVRALRRLAETEARPAGDLREVVARSVPGEGIHSAFRKCSDTVQAIKAWEAMSAIPDDDWIQIMSAIAYDVTDATLSAVARAGLVIVPREPTEAMVEEGIKAARKHIYIGDDEDGDAIMVGVDDGVKAALRAALAVKEGKP